jgi:hypothetical protein
MRKLMLIAALGFIATEASALPPVVPQRFAGQALIRRGTDSDCQGTAPFFFSRSKLGFRIVLTSPPCFTKPFGLTDDFQVQPTGGGSLWVLAFRIQDPGNDDGPMLHLLPGDPAVQAMMLWGPQEVAKYKVVGRQTGPNHYELSFRSADQGF